MSLTLWKELMPQKIKTIYYYKLSEGAESMLDEHSVIQQRDINHLSLQLRNDYYNATADRTEKYITPYGGHMTESIGAWPEFILKGTFCKRSSKGLCSPCFYSRFPLSKTNRDEYVNMIKDQISYITNNFEDLVIRSQHGQAIQNSKDVSLVLTPTGSFFDAHEFPVDVRIEMEQALVKLSEYYEINIQLHIESHCEDLIDYNVLDVKHINELELLKRLNTRVIVGFESANEYARNVLYNKNLKLPIFESAIEKIRSAGLIPGAFVFAGLFAYNDAQTHNDVISTVKYLLSCNVFPVIMFQNNQPYTISDVLLKKDKISLIEPLTVARIVSDIIKLLQEYNSYWLIADPKGGPPEPNCHIFKNANFTCKSCSNAIYDSLVNLRVTRNKNVYLKCYETIKQCDCYKKYSEYIVSLPVDLNSAKTKADILLQECHQNIILYLESKKKQLKLLELAKIKAELLCYGVRLDTCAIKNGTIKNSYLFDGGFVHAAHFLIDEIVVNTCVTESFCNKSPYEIAWENNHSVLMKNGNYVCNIDILPLPEWCLEEIDGRKIGDYFRPHSPNCISCCPKLKCTYYTDNEQCKFCSLGIHSDNGDLETKLPASVVSKMVKKALQNNPNYEIALSGGTCSSDDKSAVYFSEICNLITNYGTEKYDISVELAPPDNNTYIKQLFESGATAVIMNIEIANEELRREICPGKANIPLSRYFEAFEYAVSIFGRGNVSSVLIAGIQPAEDIINICKELIPMGVVPTIIPFKPLDNCMMNDRPIVNPDEVLHIAEKVNEILQSEKLYAREQSGCTKCGGCSLESVFQLAYQ